MKETGRSSQIQERSPEAMLAEARERLIRCRELFILSSVMLLSGILTSDKEQVVLWGNVWLNASFEEEQVTRRLIVPAKLATGAFRTVLAVEEGVRANAANFAEKTFVLKPKNAFNLAKAIVNPHIEFTKKIQKEMGVPEKHVGVKKPTIGREHNSVYRPPVKKVLTNFTITS